MKNIDVPVEKKLKKYNYYLMPPVQLFTLFTSLMYVNHIKNNN